MREYLMFILHKVLNGAIDDIIHLDKNGGLKSEFK